MTDFGFEHLQDGTDHFVRILLAWSRQGSLDGCAKLSLVCIKATAELTVEARNVADELHGLAHLVALDGGAKCSSVQNYGPNSWKILQSLKDFVIPDLRPQWVFKNEKPVGLVLVHGNIARKDKHGTVFKLKLLPFFFSMGIVQVVVEPIIVPAIDTHHAEPWFELGNGLMSLLLNL